MTVRIYPVIMSGGAGTRLWPLSRKSTPKQYHNLVADLSMMEETLGRLDIESEHEIAAPVIVCADGHQALVNSLIRERDIPVSAILVEPVPRNTAAVGALAAAYVSKIEPDGIILLLPADHYVANKQEFWNAICKGVPAAMEGYLTTLGIQPARPETGFGYIQRGESLHTGVYKVAEFREKPIFEVAERYVESGEYYWNSGIFLFRAKTMVEEFERHAEDIFNKARGALEKANHDRDCIYLDRHEFAACNSISIDHAIMEKTARAALVAPVEIGWSDIGSWSSLFDLLANKHQTSLVEIGDVISVDCARTLIRSDGPLVAAVGVEDLIIVATDDAVLVTKSSKTQDVKKIVEQLKSKRWQDLL